VARTEKAAELRDAAIRELGDADGQPELWQIYTTETTPEGKQKILEVMQHNGNTEKLAEVARTDKDPTVRKKAVEILATNKGANVSAAIAGIYGNEQDTTVKKQIISSLASERDAKSLIEMCRKEKDVELRRFIVQRLVNMRSPDVNDFLLEILK
jgi:hypothetical protein